MDMTQPWKGSKVYQRASNLLTVLTVIFVLCGSNAFAQLLEPRVTGFLGGSFLGGERSFIVDGDPFQSEFENGAKLGLRFTTDLTDIWSLEGSYSFSDNDLNITELGTPPEKRFFGVGVHHLAVNGLYYLNSSGDTRRFFVTAGIGWMHFSPSETAKILALVDDTVVRHNDQIRFVSLQVVCGSKGPQTAELELEVDGEKKTAKAEGNGPVDALFAAIKKIYPHQTSLQLYQVHAVTEGTDAQAEVTVRLEENGKTVNGLGADYDTLVASARAYVNALNKLLVKREKTAPAAMSA